MSVAAPIREAGEAELRERVRHATEAIHGSWTIDELRLLAALLELFVDIRRDH